MYCTKKAYRHHDPKILLNTSFNINGQPIVRNEQEALSTLISANLDLVVIDDLIIRPAL